MELVQGGSLHDRLAHYVGDEYGSGYLTAGRDGTVHKLCPVSG